jgi:hypothetical protein
MRVTPIMSSAHNSDATTEHDSGKELPMSKRALTTQVARSLRHEFDQQGFDLLNDHGKKGIDPTDKLGKLRSWFGPHLKFESVLADLDIAIVSRSDKKIYALIEIEETSEKPKVILGDVLATLTGKGIAFKGKHDNKVGEWTTLIVMVHITRQSQSDRLAFLSEQIDIIKRNLTTPNASIGRIIIDTFSDNVQLEGKIRQHIIDAINQLRILPGCW